MSRPDDSMIGRTIAGKFAIESLIGSGAMGHVYKAHQLALEKTVALKVLHRDLARDETFAARFHREAKAASRLDHPNSMRVIDFGAEPDGMLYIAMEFLDGRDLLRVIVDDGPMPAQRIAGILSQALAALVVAHDMGVVHRDLKPENIMVLDGLDDEGRRIDLVKVCDFGIAKITGRSGAGEGDRVTGPITTAGLVVGTPEYMSPEQGRGEPLDARSDLYSMGVILFHMLAGKVPFDAESVLGIVFKHVNEEPARPSSVRAGVDYRLESICLKALKKKRDERYQTAREMRAALRVIAGSDGVPFPTSTISRMNRPSDPVFENAKTLDMDKPRSSGSAAVSGEQLPRTSTGTAALPALPVSRPGALWVGGGALLVGVLATLLFATYGSKSTEPPVVASAAPPVSASPFDWSAATTPPSATSPVAAPDPPPRVATGAGASHAGTPVAPKAPQHSTGPAGGTAAASTSFSPATASVNPAVLRATGVSARDVRGALPAGKFTQCYRDALSRAGKRLEGHATLSMTIDPSGVVTRVSLTGPPPLLTNAGGCFEDAVNQLPVRNSSAMGATADIDLACVPE